MWYEEMKHDITDLYRRCEATLITPDGREAGAEASLLCEHELDVTINGRYEMKLVCTGQYLNELVTGRLITGGYTESVKDIDKILFCRDAKQADVFLKRHTGRTEPRKLPKPEVKSDWIFSMAKQFEKGTPLHDLTSAAHSCIISRKGEILFACEDIGRHNAVDKAVGYAANSGVDLSECILYTSGRVPVDMAEKSIAAGIPVLAAKASPTAEAVDLARKYGLTLIGNARPDAIKLFCH